MSKNIDEIENIFPSGMVIPIDGKDVGYPLGIARAMVKQALIEKKLVVPLTLTKLGEIFNEVRHDNLTDFQISQVIYEAQFKGDE